MYSAVYDCFSGTIAFLLQLKDNIQLMIADYKDTCQEREELLYSLADVSAVLAKKRVYILFCFSFLFSSPLIFSFSIPLHSLILHISFSNPFFSFVCFPPSPL